MEQAQIQNFTNRRFESRNQEVRQEFKHIEHHVEKREFHYENRFEQRNQVLKNYEQPAFSYHHTRPHQLYSGSHEARYGDFYRRPDTSYAYA